MHTCTKLRLGSGSADDEAEVTVVYGPVSDPPVDIRMEYWWKRRPEHPTAVPRWRVAAALAGWKSLIAGGNLLVQ